MDPVSMFIEGGVWMYAVLATGTAGCLASGLAALVFGGLGWRWPTPLVWLIAAAVVAVGGIGSWSSAQLAIGALGVASYDMQASFAGAGAAVSHYPLIFAWLMVPWVLLSAALPLGLVTAVRPGPEPRPDAGGLAGVFLGLSLGLVVSAIILGMGGGFTSGATPLIQVVTSLLFIGGFALASALASARRPGAHAPLDEGRLHEARLGGTRLFIGLSAVLACYAMSRASGMMADSQVLTAFSVASPELKGILLAHGEAMGAASSLFGWALAMPPLFMALGSTMGFIGRLDQRNLGFSLLAPVALGLIVVSQLPARNSIASLASIVGIDGAWQHAAEALGDDLPSSQAPLPGPSCVAVRDGRWHGTAPGFLELPWCTDPLTETSLADHWVLALRKGTPAKAVVDRPWGPERSELGLLVKTPNQAPGSSPLMSYGAAHWTWLGSLPDSGLNTIPRSTSGEAQPKNTVIIWDTPEGDRFLRLAPDAAPLTAESLAASEPFALNRNDPNETREAGEKGSRLVFVPGERWTVDELLDRCSPAHNDNHCVIMPATALPLPVPEEDPDAK